MRALMLSLVAACVGPALLAQAPNPLVAAPARPKHLVVTASTSAADVKAGGRVVLYLDVRPDPGIHVYAPGAKGYTPIAFAVRPPAGFISGDTQYPKSDMFFFAALAERVAVYQKPFRLSRTLTMGKTAKARGRVTVGGTLDYQACDDQICFVPESVPVAWTLIVR